MTNQTGVRATQVKDAVFSILERFPETRDDDSALMLRYWAGVDGLVFDYTFPQRFIEHGTSPESITRARRAIQAQGVFLPSDEAVARRRQRQVELREHFATNS